MEQGIETPGVVQLMCAETDDPDLTVSFRAAARERGLDLPPANNSRVWQAEIAERYERTRGPTPRWMNTLTGCSAC